MPLTDKKSFVGFFLVMARTWSALKCIREVTIGVVLTFLGSQHIFDQH